MENRGEKTINITKKINKIVSILTILFTIAALAGIFYLFIRPANSRIRTKIKKDIEKINIQLDKDAISGLETRETFGQP